VSNATSYLDSTAAPNTAYSYRVLAYNAAGNSAYSDPASATTPAQPVTGTSASFTSSDAATQGNWRGVYGSDGYVLPDGNASLPAYADLSISGANAYIWAASTTDTRALQDPTGTGRRAACWYGNTFTYDVALSDGATHRVGLYALDWDGQGRTQHVEVLNADTGAVLDSRDLASFAGGRYLAWDVRGHVQIRITNLGGGNAVISGLFFDAIAGPAPIAVVSATEDLAPGFSNIGAPSTSTELLQQSRAQDVPDSGKLDNVIKTSHPARLVGVFAKPSFSNIRKIRRYIFDPDG
jgi:hypothetical protein